MPGWVQSVDHRSRRWNRPAEYCTRDDQFREQDRIGLRGIFHRTMRRCDRRERLQCDGRDPGAWAIRSGMLRGKSMMSQSTVGHRRSRRDWLSIRRPICSLAEEEMVLATVEPDEVVCAVVHWTWKTVGSCEEVRETSFESVIENVEKQEAVF